MLASLSVLSGRCPPEHLAAFTWIVETVVAGANDVRGDAFRVAPAALFHPPVRGAGKSPRLLAAHLASELLGWPHRTLYAVFHPASSPAYYDGQLAFLARRWVRQGCLDQLSGRSFMAIRDHVLADFPFAPIPEVQNLSANKPPELVLPRPPPRRQVSQPRLQQAASSSPSRPITIDHVITTVAHLFGLTKDELLSNTRRRDIVLPRQIGMYLARRLTRRSFKHIARAFNRRDHTTSLHAVRKIGLRAAADPEFKAELEQLIKRIRSSTGELAGRRSSQELQAVSGARSHPDIAASSLIGLDVPLADAPFLRRLHPRLAKASIAMDFNVKDFIAEMIAEAIRRKSNLRPLAPHPFRQILGCNHLDLPDHLVPHAMFIQHALYDFAALLPTRGSLKDRSLVIRQIKPGAAAAGD
jgi:Bacterial dnaA protein helix-turn-helix